MIVTIFTFTNGHLLFSANATYIEGPITQDTVWTLIDSPFVVSKNVTIQQNATLTIEPGVEIRFGGKFSLIVNGRLVAKGTPDKIITFTSNKVTPEPGDWNAIESNGPQAQSILAYCSLKYAKDGLIIKNSTAKIENSIINNNSENGVRIENSTAIIYGNEIANNSRSGIYISGNNAVIIQNNTIKLNGDGILLTRSSTSGVNISQNIMIFNTQSGIHLDANSYSDVSILHNTLSTNNIGFHITGNASTYVSYNSISYNVVGFLYEQAEEHEAHWNDIYGNELGMEVLGDAVVNATYNYWGHKSGPYHVSLNPAGKGNPVGGDGVNLDFIFFLTAPVGYKDQNKPPIVKLLTDKKVVSLNQNVTFIATTSWDEGRVDQYFFDFGDGKNSGWTTLSMFVHKYSSIGTYYATLKVMDDFGAINATVPLEIKCQSLLPLDVSLTPSNFNASAGEQVSVTVHVTDGTSAVENANITLFAIWGRNFASLSGLTNSTGHFATLFTAPDVTEITNLRMTVTASKDGYADGSDYKYLMILPPLQVEVTANPDTIKSEATSNIMVHVTHNGMPISDAVVITFSDRGGSFDQEVKTTDINGDCMFIFTAPQTTTKFEVTICVTAIISGYLESQGQTKITVEPKVLSVQVVANPVLIKSEMMSNVTVLVTYESNPISDVTVTLSSDKGGSFSPQNKTTDMYGMCVFTFTSPQVTVPTNITITATATKAGYVAATGTTQITVNLRTLQVQVTTTSTTVESKKTLTLTVQVTYDAKPVADAVVTVSSGGTGAFSTTTGNTDSNGYCTFVFTAPQTTTQLEVNVVATATKSGYLDGKGEISIIVTPEVAPSTPVSGLPLTMILLIAAIIIVIAIVLILIKLKIIVITWKE
jgi:parallel beta-helix repeat protein